MVITPPSIFPPRMKTSFSFFDICGSSRRARARFVSGPRHTRVIFPVSTHTPHILHTLQRQNWKKHTQNWRNMAVGWKGYEHPEYVLKETRRPWCLLFIIQIKNNWKKNCTINFKFFGSKYFLLDTFLLPCDLHDWQSLKISNQLLLL